MSPPGFPAPLSTTPRAGCALVAITIPCHPARATVADGVRAALAQTSTDVEILCAEGGHLPRVALQGVEP